MTDTPASERPKRLLFICTGNYYRSRFAEHLFNTLARERGLPWHADSRGTDLAVAGAHNVGPISAYARRALEERGIEVGPAPRFPAQLDEAALADADLIIAVCESEHRPDVERDFPEWVERVEYWSVDDLGLTPADEALSVLHQHVTCLVDRLATDPE